VPRGIEALRQRQLIPPQNPAPFLNSLAIPVAASYLLRRGGETSGPYPRGLLQRHLALGRVAPHDEISVDGVQWVAIADVPDLAEEADSPNEAPATSDPQWQEERRRARLRWLDERAQPDRRAGSESTPSESRRGGDRRADPTPPRKLFGPNDENTAPSVTSLRVVLVVVLVVAIASAVLLWFVPQYAPTVRLLNRSAIPQTLHVPAEPIS